MSEAVDTRVVEAKFDSSDFERGVDRTVKKLDELKQSLDLEKTGESVASLASKTSSALDKIENRITTFTGMLKQKLLGGLADEIVSVFFKIKSGFESLVSSLSTQQVGSGMSRYVEMMTSVRTMVFSGVDQSAAYATIERLGVYADQTSYSLDALSSTMSKFRTAGADLATAERMVIGLSNAAASMGVNAQDAQRAYLNLQQAYSKGYMMQNDWISFESLPMVGDKFNQKILDAAVAVGTLEKQVDGTYKTTKKVDKMVQTSGAAASGITAQNLGSKLASKWFNKKVMEEVFGSSYYFNIDDEDASDIISDLKEKEKEVKKAAKDKYEAANTEKAKLDKLKEETNMSQTEYENRLRAILESHDINVDTDNFNYDAIYENMFQAELNTVSSELYEKKKKELDASLKEGTLTMEQYKAALDDLKKSTALTVFGWEAFRAGQEARSFTDVLNTLKDAISRGWAKSFELIFGQLDKAAEFFTWLTETKLADAIYAIGDFRNAVLGIWSGGDENNSGRQNILMGLKALDDLLGRILGRFTIFSGDEEALEQSALDWGGRLSDFSKDFKDFANSLNAWFTDDRIERIRSFVTTVGSLIGTFFKVLATGFNFIQDLLVKLSPVFDKVSDAFTSVLERINNNISTDGINALENAFTNILTAIDPLITPLGKVVDFLGEIGVLLADVFSNSYISVIDLFADALGFVIELFGGTSAQKAKDGAGILDRLKKSVTSLGEACKDAFTFIKDFFHNLFDDLRLVFGLREAREGEEGFFVSIANYFKTDETVKAIKETIKSFPKKVANLAKTVWKAIDEFLFGKKISYKIDADEKGNTVFATKRVKSAFGKWLENTVKTIKEWIKNDLPKKIKELWNEILDFFLGKKSEESVSSATSNGTGVNPERVKEGFSLWLDETIKKIKNWITVTLPSKVKTLWNSILDFVLGKRVSSDLVGKEKPNGQGVYAVTDRVKEGFSLWLSDLKTKVVDWFTNKETGFPAKVGKIWSTIVDTIFGKPVSEDLIGKPRADGEGTYTANDRIKEGFSLWLDNTITKVVNWFTDTESGFPAKVGKIWSTIVDAIFGKEIPEELIGKPTPDGKGTYAATDRVKTGFSLWLDNTITAIRTWAAGIPETIKNLWGYVIGAIFGSKETISGDTIVWDESYYQELLEKNPIDAEEYKKWYDSQKDPILDVVTNFVDGLGTDIGKILSTLPAKIVNAWTFSLDLFDTLLDGVSAWLGNLSSGGKDVSAEISAIADNIASYIAGDESVDLNPLVKSVIDFGLKLKDIITVTIPGVLSGAWNVFSNGDDSIAHELWQAIESIFDPNDKINWETITAKAAEIGNGIADAIRGIPSVIRAAVGNIKDLFDYDPYEEAKDQITKAFSDENGNIIDRKGYNNALKETRKLLENSPKESGIVHAIKEIGLSIKDAFIDLAPDILDGINTIFTWIGNALTRAADWMANRDKNEDFIDSLSKEMFDEDEKASGFADAVRNIGQTLYNLITVIIPNFLKEAFIEVINGIPKIINSIFNSDNGEGITKTMSDAVENMSFDASSLATTFEQNFFGGASFTNVSAKMKKRTEVIEDLKKQVEEEEKVLMLMRGDSTKNKTEEYKERVARKKQLLSWIDELENDEVVSKLEEVNANNYSIKQVEKADEGINSVMDIINYIFGAFNSIGSGDAAASIAKAAAIIVLIVEIRKIIDNLVFTDDPGWAIKWSALKTLFMGLFGVVAYLIYISATGDTTQMANVKSVFDSLVSLFDKIAIVLGILKTIKMVTAAIEVTGGVTKTGFWSNFGQHFGKFAGWLLGGAVVIGETGEIVTESMSSWSTNLTETFETIEDGMDDLLKTVTDLEEILPHIDAAKEAVGRVGELFDELRGIFIISKTGTYTYELPYDEWSDHNTIEDFENAGKTYEVEVKNISDEFLAITQMFIQLSGAIAIFKQAVTTKADENTTSITDALASVIGMKDGMIEFTGFVNSGYFEDFKFALMSLGSIMQLYTMSNDNVLIARLDDLQIENAVDIIQKLFGNKQLSGLISSLSKDEIGDTRELMKNAESISIFANALIMIAKACMDITDDTSGNINTLITTLQDITISQKTDDEITTISRNFGELGSAIGSFAVNTTALTSDQIKNASDALDMILRLAIGLNNIPSTSFLAKIFTGDKSITNFGIGIENLGKNLYSFFEKINAIKHTVNDVDTDRKNLEMALMAIDVISRITSRLANTQSFNSKSGISAKEWQETLEGYIGSGTALMKFINEINGYNTEDNKTVNFNFVYNAIDAMIKIIDMINKMPNYKNLTSKIKDVGTILIGNKADANNNDVKHGGVLGYLNGFFAAVIDISKRDDSQFDLESISSVMTAYSDMVRQIVDLLKYIGGTEGDALGVIETKNPMEYLIPVFTSINENYSSFEEFLNHAAGFNQDGIKSALDLFKALHELGAGLQIFSNWDERSGNYSVLEGLSTLLGFNWSGLEGVKDSMVSIFTDLNGLDSNPQITPVLNISDDFISKANTMRQMLGVGTVSFNGGEFAIPNMALNLADSITFPMQPNYNSKLDTIIQKIGDVQVTSAGVATAVSRMQFNVDGKSFANVMGPYIDKYLGNEKVTYKR